LGSDRVLDRRGCSTKPGWSTKRGAPAAKAKPARKKRSAWTSVRPAPLALDHRRILASALGRLRGKIRYRPVVFELMPPAFTLFALQRVVEALSGSRLHKQNFRRLVEEGGLVEGTGRLETRTGAARRTVPFRREVLRERPAPGVRQSRTVLTREISPLG
jgi:hypothetical protein